MQGAAQVGAIGAAHVAATGAAQVGAGAQQLRAGAQHLGLQHFILQRLSFGIRQQCRFWQQFDWQPPDWQQLAAGAAQVGAGAAHETGAQQLGAGAQQLLGAQLPQRFR